MLFGMHVTRNTPDQLIIADTPWVIGILLILFVLSFVGPGLLLVSDGIWQGWIFAIAGGGMGIIAFGVFVRRLQLILDRPSDTITIRRRSIFGISTLTHTLSNLSKVKIETTTGSKGRRLFRPTLVLTQGMSAGDHPIVQAYTNSGSSRRVADAVNLWLANAS
ncbi:MAG: hypothetical protein ACI92Z_001309 [Paracoccaceae bacterium]|jgi:hypothetical protein